MPFKVGIIDVVAVIVVGIVVLLPDRAVNVNAAAEPEDARQLAMYQARLSANPEDGVAAEDMAEKLVRMKQTDWALRVAGAAALRDPYPTRWHAQRAVSAAHIERLEVKPAYDFAKRALADCDAYEKDCPQFERVRLQMYVNELEAGLAALREGINPKTQAKEFREHVNRATPRSTLRSGAGSGGRRAPTDDEDDSE